MKIKSIQVLGSACPTCKQLFETTKKVVEELKINIEVEYINDVVKMVEMGVMTSPILAIDGKPVLMGSGKSEEDIKEAILGKNVKDDCSGNCSCC